MNIEQSPEDEIVSAEPTPNTHPAPQSRKRRHWVVAVVAFVLVAAVYVGGVLPRVKARAALKTETAEMAIPTVAVVQPQATAPAQELVLPANVQPYIVAPIYARTNGYLKAWYVDIGAHVKQGQLLAVIETPEIDHQLQQARANLATAQANLNLSRITAERFQGLLKSNSVAQQDTDNAVGTYNANQAIVQSNSANVKQLEALQSFQRIYAPFDGIITVRNTDVGALINSGSGGGPTTQLFQIAQPQKLRVYANVPEAYSKAVREGMTARLTLAEFPGRQFEGKLVRTAEAIDPATRTLLVEISVNNPTGTLFSGSYAEVHIKLPGGASTFTIPVSALLFRSEGLRVATVQNGDRAQLVPVTAGHDFGDRIEIVAGLKGGESIVLNPPDSISSGQPVRVSHASTPGGSVMLAHRPSYRSHTFVLLILALLAAIVLASCTVGPKYQRPPVPAPPEFKETGNWKPAQPSDEMLKGNWWELFGDPQLNSLEAQVNVSNQSLKAAQQQFLQARSLIKFNRADYFPTVSVNPSAARTRESAHRPLLVTSDGQTFNDFILPVDVSYEPDLWGRVRRTVEESRENAQASFGDVENVSLSLHAELAMDYLQLRGLDAEEQLLTSTVEAFKEALQLTLNRFHGGVASEVDVAQAETQLKTTQAQAIDVAVARAQFEHTIAVLIGKPPATFALAPNPLTTPPPAIPPGLPSQLLERRPDIAASERRMAAANAQIGVAKTAYYPLVSLAASGGFETAALGTLLNGPSGFWSIGGAAAQTIFEGGRRRAVSDQAREGYDQNVANYRQTVLTAFQEVEDNLAAQRILSDENRTQDDAVAAAQHSLDLSTTRYKGGVTTYLEVLTAQSVALSDERTDVQILERRMAASVLLIKALGGGWNVSQMPTLASVDHASATAGK